MSHVAKSAEFSLTPSGYTLVAKLSLAVAAALVIALLPIILLAKSIGLLLLLVVGYSFCQRFSQQKPERLVVVGTDAEYWRLMPPVDNKRVGYEIAVDVRLESRQFVTAYLVILYFRTLQGERLIRVIPRDSLSGGEHRILRKMLLARTSCD